MRNREEARKKAEALVSQMTLEEKASQLKYDAPAIPRLNVPAYNWWNEALHGVARAGTATVFPQAIGLAAMFDADFHREIAEAISLQKLGRHEKPCIFLNVGGFYDPQREMLRRMVEEGFLRKEDLDRICFADRVDDLDRILG